jgi:capsular polysaccharide export protein
MEDRSCEGAFARHASLRNEGAVVAFHMKAWKHSFLRAFFPNKRIHFVDFQMNESAFRKKVLPILSDSSRPVVFVWGNNLPDYALQAIEAIGLQTLHIEDGFIRSLEGHAGYSVPFSLSLDAQRPYFDSRGPSDLEDVLLTYDFDRDADLLDRATIGMATMLKQRLTKYNAPLSAKGEAPENTESTAHRILVIGQVEEDASIRFGCDRPFSNNDLVRLAATENPDAVISYKPHPDVMSGMRRQVSDPADVAHLCTILNGTVSLPDALDQSDHVYTITSLSGFEALMRGKKVTVVGAPFYAGWGLTNDLQPMPRRGRQLSLEKVFAAAYILYPSYFDPSNGKPVRFEETLQRVTSRQSPMERATPPPTSWAPVGAYGVLGWRHLMTPVIARIVAKIGSENDAIQYRRNPAIFFRELSSVNYRLIGRILYPWH